MKDNALTEGGLRLGSEFLYTKKSAESIVAVVTSRANENDKLRTPHQAAKGGTLNSGYASWISTKLKPLANAARETETYANN